MSATMWRGLSWGLGENFSKGTSDSERLRATRGDSDQSGQGGSERLRATQRCLARPDPGHLPCVPDLLQLGRSGWKGVSAQG